MRMATQGRSCRIQAPWRLAILVLVALAATAALLSACSLGSPAGDEEAQRATAEATLGIRVIAVTLSAGGGLVDLRYQVLDPDKASVLGGDHGSDSEDLEEFYEDFKDRPLLVDEASGYAVVEAHMHLAGRARKQREEPKAGQAYSILFSNTGSLVEPGSKVSLVIGDLRLEHLVVQ